MAERPFRPIYRVTRCVMAALAAVAVAACARPPERTQRFVGFIAGLERAEPIYPEALEHLLGWKPHCTDPDNGSGRIDCHAHEFELAGIRVGTLDFRSSRNRGSILILQPLEGDCLAVDAFDEQFGKGVLTGGCTDGVICVYRTYKRPWGRLALDPGGGRSDQCAQSVILDSYPR